MTPLSLSDKYEVKILQEGEKNETDMVRQKDTHRDIKIWKGVVIDSCFLTFVLLERDLFVFTV